LHEVQASLRRRRDRVLGRVGVLRSRGRTRPFRQCAGHGRFRRDRGNGPAAGLTWTPPRRSRAAGSTAHLSGGRMHHRPRQRRRGALYGRLSFTRSSSPPRPRAPSSLQRLTIFGSDRRHSGHFWRSLEMSKMTPSRVRQESWQRIGGASLPRGKA
jgi:hypothetical protein